MGLLFFEIWVFLLLAFLLGMFVQWFFCCRDKKDDSNHGQSNNDIEQHTRDSMATVTTPLASSAALAETETESINDDWRPMGLSDAPSDSDELKRIKGIGSVIEETLNGLGIYQFKQIANWDENNVLWVENFLAFPGRIKREDWITQAKTLAEGGSTEFAARVDKGDVKYEA